MGFRVYFDMKTKLSGRVSKVLIDVYYCLCRRHMANIDYFVILILLLARFVSATLLLVKFSLLKNNFEGP